MKKRNILMAIIGGLIPSGLYKPNEVKPYSEASHIGFDPAKPGAEKTVETTFSNGVPVKQVMRHSSKLNKAEFNRSRKARKRIRDQQKSIENNPCIDTWA